MLKEGTCTFTGHRPDKLYGYDLDNPNYQKIAQLLSKQLEELILNKGIKNFISGGAIGYDTVAFFSVQFLKRKYPFIRNILAVPFENQYIKWNPIDKQRYFRMKEMADEIIYVDTIPEYVIKDNVSVGHYSNPKMQKRNEYMVNNARYMIALWNGDKKSGTYNCIKYLKKQNNYNDVFIINPITFNIDKIT